MSSVLTLMQHAIARQCKGLPLIERRQLRREKLLMAAFTLYGTRGFFAVTIKDICLEAGLTERYFYESFKRSEELFKTLYLMLIDDLQQQITFAVLKVAPNAEQMIRQGLNILLETLQNDPRVARILFIDAILVQELHGDTILESFHRFELTISQFVSVLLPNFKNTTQLQLIATGLNGYVNQIALRWITGGFVQPLEEVLQACCLVYQSVLNQLSSI